ncbi:MAG: aminotransferase class I/II-fold pyridoxal phosphate-dependent enzyme [Collinsella sp.]
MARPGDFELDQAAVLAAAPECNLAIVTSPNNPTGDVAPLDFVAALCDACPGMVMVDEAYVEFADDSFGAATTAQGLIAEHPNLVILHTLSKAFGAAGTRLGYVIAAPEVIDVFAAIRQIYSVNVLSQAAALCLCACPRCVRARGGTGRIRARARAVRPARDGCRGSARGGVAERGELCARAYAACHARARASAR